MKTIDILPICFILSQMWKETAIRNQMRFIMNDELSKIITRTKESHMVRQLASLTLRW